jgi:hypothetical protein
MVKSRFSFRYFYSNYLIVALMLTSAIYGLTHRAQMIVVKHGVGQDGQVICYVLLALGVFSLFFLLKNAVVVKVWPDRLVLQRLFSRTTIRKEDIVSIDLEARKRSVLHRRLMVDAIVVDRGEAQNSIMVNFYGNAPEIKRALQRYLMPVQAGETAGHIVPAEAAADRTSVKYSRSWLTSGYGLMFCVVLIIICLACFAIATGALAVRPGVFVALILPAYFGGGALQYYFLVDEDELIVRNQFFPWYDRRFRLAGIRSAVIENRSGMTIALRITMMDFERHVFIAESLRQPEWKALTKRLGENGILVVDEAY